MSTQPFSETEIETLRKGATGAGLLVAVSDRGFFDSFKEAGAMAKHFAAAKESSESPVIRQLAEGRGTGFGVTSSKSEVESGTLDALRSAVELLRSKAPDELDAYRTFVLELARSVGSAAGGGEEAEAADDRADRAGTRRGLEQQRDEPDRDSASSRAKITTPAIRPNRTSRPGATRRRSSFSTASVMSVAARPRSAPVRAASASCTCRSIRGPSPASGPSSSSRTRASAWVGQLDLAPRDVHGVLTGRHRRGDGQVVAQPRTLELEQPLGGVEVLEPVLADVLQRQAVEVAAHERARRLGHEHLPARASEQMRAARTTSRPRYPSSPSAGSPGVDAHPDEHGDSSGHSWSARSRWIVAAAASAFLARGKTAKKASPWRSTSRPPASANASRRIRLCPPRRRPSDRPGAGAAASSLRCPRRGR